MCIEINGLLYDRTMPLRSCQSHCFYLTPLFAFTIREACRENITRLDVYIPMHALNSSFLSHTLPRDNTPIFLTKRQISPPISINHWHSNPTTMTDINRSHRTNSATDTVVDLVPNHDAAITRQLVREDLTIGFAQHPETESTNGTGVLLESRIRLQGPTAGGTAAWLDRYESAELSAQELGDLQDWWYPPEQNEPYEHGSPQGRMVAGQMSNSAQNAEVHQDTEMELGTPDDGNGDAMPEFDSVEFSDREFEDSIFASDTLSVSESESPQEYTIPAERPANLELLAQCPCGTSHPTPTPAHFPPRIVQLIHLLPFVKDGETVHDVRKTLVDLIGGIFASSSPEEKLLEQVAALLEWAPLSVLKVIVNMVTTLVITCIYSRTAAEFPLEGLTQVHWDTWGSTFSTWLASVPDEILEETFGIPVTASHLTHFISHVQVFVEPAPSVNFTLALTSCPEALYTPKPSRAMVEKFIDALPTVNSESLAEDDRACGICREPYDKLEVAVKLPCTHVFGKPCLAALLGPKPEGWEHTMCPLCRAEAPLLSQTALGAFLHNG